LSAPPLIRSPNGARRVLGVVLALAAFATAEPASARVPVEASALKRLLAGPPVAAVSGALEGGATLRGGRLRVPRLPLGARGLRRARLAGVAVGPSRAAGFAALVERRGPTRVLVSARRHRDVAALARYLRRRGRDVSVIPTIAVIAVTVDDPAALASAARGDRRVAAIEPVATYRTSADPADEIDPESGIPYGWAYDAVQAGPAIAAVGGGSRRIVAVIDTGADVAHPDLSGRIAGTLDANTGSDDVRDGVGHGTFVSGLVSMVADNEVGAKGVAGATRLFAIRADNGRGEFSSDVLIAAKDAAIRSGADILNLSLGGSAISASEARVLEFAFLNDVLPVAASGNEGDAGNPLQYPAAAIGGERGEVGIGLSVGAVEPDGGPAPFSTHNRFVSVAAPGASPQDCKGVFSTVPQQRTLIFDAPRGCGVYQMGGRYAYSQGTSFAAPIGAGVAALAWQAQPRLASEQVADVVQRSAVQTFGRPGWNEFTGWGIVNAQRAVEVARRYDVTEPTFRTRTRRRGRRVTIRVFGGHDRTAPGAELAGGVTYGLALERSGEVTFLVRPRRGPISRSITVRRRTTLVALACDANGNCATRRLRLRP
jgi:subtilisin family serine protease